MSSSDFCEMSLSGAFVWSRGLDLSPDRFIDVILGAKPALLLQSAVQSIQSQNIAEFRRRNGDDGHNQFRGQPTSNSDRKSLNLTQRLDRPSNLGRFCEKSSRQKRFKRAQVG
jgi:hypothetical protein